MTAISQIELSIETVNHPHAGTDADIYLGLAGREFHVDSDRVDFDDFEPGSHKTYIFGHDGANVADPKNNDPTDPWPIDSDDIGRCPRYIRLEESNEHNNVTWNVASVRLVVKDKFGHSSFTAERLGGGANLWMGAGKKIFHSRYLYFR